MMIIRADNSDKDGKMRKKKTQINVCQGSLETDYLFY